MKIPMFTNSVLIGHCKISIITVILVFSMCTKMFSQQNEIPDTAMYKQLGLANEALHYLYTDTIKTSIVNYEWPFFEISILTGLDINNWTFAKPEKQFALDVIEFENEFDGILRKAEMGNYDIELKLNTSYIEFFAQYNSHYIPYQPYLDDDEAMFAENSEYSRNKPTHKNEIRAGFNVIIKKSQKSATKNFNTLRNSGNNIEIYTDFAYTKNDTAFYGDTKFVDIIYNYPAIENIVSHTYTAFNIGYIRSSFPIVYDQEEQFTYYPEFDHSILTSYLMHWDRYGVNGLSIGIMQRKFSRYKVDINSPIDQKYGLGQAFQEYRCPFMEYGVNVFLGAPQKTENDLPFDLSQTGGEIYFKTGWEPLMLKFAAGKMIGRPNNWFFRASLGFTIRGGNTILSTEERKYLIKDYL